MLTGDSTMADKMSRTLGDAIREARVAKAKGLREAARDLDITPSYMSDIENDRRVPAEDVLQKIASLLSLDFNDLMALAGRLGEDTERYMRRHPTAGTLFRRITEKNFGEDKLRKLLDRADELGEEDGK
jgi:transcriptional regulator with XRE-family HTH domain